ncbi:RNA 3'-terminal phosphate cyclase [Candidatus Woesearchaeota archaeon]|nr:RNA 3'-terminal phosphate cyclase [Candidatus Woesearchaeota archaeon]
MITLDGSHGEGGGQILRTALALSMITQKSFKIEKIRANRPKPGLKAQHMTGIKTLQELSGCVAKGAEIGSETLEFIPKPINKFRANIDVGTAGAITLVLQSILLPLMTAEKESRIKITGGTDVLWSPPIDYFLNVMMPHLQEYADVKIKLEKRGHFPKGGGKIDLAVRPKENKDKLNLTKREELIQIKGISHSTKELMDAQVAERQARAAKFFLNKLDVPVTINKQYADSDSTGSGITLWALYGVDGEVSTDNPVILGGDAFGQRGKKAEVVGEEAAKTIYDEIMSHAAVDSHLCDNLIPFLGLFGGEIKTSKITQHTKSNIYVTEKFWDVKFEVNEEKKIILCMNRYY